MKKNYVKPVIQATAIEGTCILNTSVKSNLADGDKIKVGGGSSTSSGGSTARSKDRGFWNDEEEWEEDW